MPALIVAITTYNRRDKLCLLLKAIDQQQLPKSLEDSVAILLVDNSPEATAASIACEYRTSGRFPLHYVPEKRRGLSFARNAVLEAVTPIGGYVAMIDDDEVPVPRWLASLYGCLESTSAAVAVGPVQPIFGRPMPSWIVLGEWFAKQPDASGGYVSEGYTSNCIIRVSVVQDLGLRFDSRFNSTGGEDTYFFNDLVRRSHRIAWAEDAVVLEWIGLERTRLSWLARRWYRTGGTEAYLGPYAPTSLPGRCHNVGRGAIRVIGGMTLVLLHAGANWKRPTMAIEALRTMFRGLGLIGNAFGREHNEYSDPRYR
jgi:succinoglycan biosynthesis protein ExoM